MAEPPSAELAAYGFGWIVRDYQQTRIVEHGGAIGGFSAFTVLVPDYQLGFCLLTNLAIADALGPLLAMRLEVLHVLLDAAGGQRQLRGQGGERTT